MMLSDKDSRFDEMLSSALRGRSEAVPSDFTEGVLRQIEQVEQQRALARVVLQERLALSGCIFLGIVLIFLVVVFPDVIAGFRGQIGTFLIAKLNEVVRLIALQWQIYLVFAGVLGFAVYSYIDSLLTGG